GRSLHSATQAPSGADRSMAREVLRCRRGPCAEAPALHAGGHKHRVTRRAAKLRGRYGLTQVDAQVRNEESAESWHRPKDVTSAAPPLGALPGVGQREMIADAGTADHCGTPLTLPALAWRRQGRECLGPAVRQ